MRRSGRRKKKRKIYMRMKVRAISRLRRKKLFKTPPLHPRFKYELISSEKEIPGKKKRLKELSELIALGKEKGHLTFEEVNNILPVDIVSSEEIDEILGILGDENIKLVDSEEELSKERLEEEVIEEKKEEVPKEEIAKLIQIDDPVKM